MTDVLAHEQVGAGGRTEVRPPLSRLTRVELRKMVDTRSGFWLQLAVAALSPDLPRRLRGSVSSGLFPVTSPHTH